MLTLGTWQPSMRSLQNPQYRCERVPGYSKPKAECYGSRTWNGTGWDSVEVAPQWRIHEESLWAEALDGYQRGFLAIP